MLLALGMSFCAGYSQNCADYIQSAGKMYDKYRKTKDIKQLEEARKLLTNIINTPGNPKKCREAAENMLNTFSNTGSTNTPKGKPHYVVYHKQQSDLIVGTELVFDADGGVCSDVMITCSDWFSSLPPKDTSWLSVSEGTSCLVVRCAPNLSREERECSIGIICDNGTRMGNVTVQQKAGGEVSHPVMQDSEASVKISFETGKAVPVFENVGSIIKTLEDNKDLDLQIEMTWCKQSWLKDLFGSSLVKKRIKKITEFFVTSGVDKNRIHKKITLTEGEAGGAECDCAYAKVVKNATDAQK